MKYIIILVSILFVSQKIRSENYAILISPGTTTQDCEYFNSEYWFDLFLAYEDLIIKKGYSHNNVFVFYGLDGSDYETSAYKNRYNKSLHGWTNDITDYPATSSSLENYFNIISSNHIDYDDQVFIRWIVGHGDRHFPYGRDDYYVKLDHPGFDDDEQIDKQDLINLLNTIEYKRRIIFWSTCYSGCMIEGNVNIKDPNSLVLTSSEWNESSFVYQLPGETYHANFNYIITSASYGEDPVGIIRNVDSNNDDYISMDELYQEYLDPPIPNPPGGMYDSEGSIRKLYFDHVINLDNKSLNSEHEYMSEEILTHNLTIKSNSYVLFEPDDSIILSNKFEIKLGAVLEIK